MASTRLVLSIDNRLGGVPQYIITEEGSVPMLVPDEMRNCVAFLCFKGKDQNMSLAGTAFFVLVRPELETGFIYLVTAKHVIDGIKRNSIDNIVYIRMNLVIGGVQLVPVSLDAWKSHPNNQSVDASVLPWSPQRETFDYRALLSDMAATNDIIAKEGIGVGDEVFMTGLFVNHFGKNRNQPIIRIGNMALMPNEPIYTSDLGDIDAYLIEARSMSFLRLIDHPVSS